MDDYIIYKFLRTQPDDITEKEFIEGFKKYIVENPKHEYSKGSITIEIKDNNNKVNIVNCVNEHFNEPYAKYIVSNMYHYSGNTKCIGEKYSMDKAKEVCMKYSTDIDKHITYSDIYVAINAQYHDYYEVLKPHIECNIDSVIIDSAIAFWFKDDDYSKGSKLWNYFH